MKKIINGRIFDTNESTVLFEYENDKFSALDFGIARQRIYKTKNSSFFIENLSVENFCIKEVSASTVIQIFERCARSDELERFIREMRPFLKDA